MTDLVQMTIIVFPERKSHGPKVRISRTFRFRDTTGQISELNIRTKRGLRNIFKANEKALVANNDRVDHWSFNLLQSRRAIQSAKQQALNVTRTLLAGDPESIGLEIEDLNPDSPIRFRNAKSGTVLEDLRRHVEDATECHFSIANCG